MVSRTPSLPFFRYMLENQCITLDWWEGHFRLENKDLFRINTDRSNSSMIHQDPEGHPDPETDPQRPVESVTGSSSAPRMKLETTRPLPGVDKFTTGKTTFKRLHSAGKYFQDYYQIWRKGKLFGVMLANSYNKTNVPSDDIMIQVANNRFYEDGWHDQLTSLTQEIGATFHNFTRMDIAIDGGRYFEAWDLYRKELPFCEIKSHTVAKELIKVGKAGYNDYYNHKKQLTGFYIGKGISKKRAKCYNKSAELTKSNKTYIEKFWKRNNIDTSRPVERFELTVKNDECKKFKEISFDKLSQPKHLADIFRANIKGFTEFRMKTDGKNINRWPCYELVDWEQLQGTGLEKDSTKPSNEIWSAKLTIKKLFEISYIHKVQEYYDIALEIAINTDLIGWLSKMQPHWINDINTKGIKAGGDLSELPWKFHFKRYQPGEQVVLHVA